MKDQGVVLIRRSGEGRSGRHYQAVSGIGMGAEKGSGSLFDYVDQWVGQVNGPKSYWKSQ